MNVIEKEELKMAGLYWKRPIEITHGSGVHLWDRDGNKYLDCTSNYGVAITGHCHPRVVEAVQRQAEKLLSCHGTFYNEARSEFLEKLISIAPGTWIKPSCQIVEQSPWNLPSSWQGEAQENQE